LETLSLFRKVSREEKQAILSRFDVRNAKRKGEKFVIDLPCIVCLKYGHDCGICSFFPCFLWLWSLWKDYFKDEPLPDEKPFFAIGFHSDCIIFDAESRKDLEILQQQLDKYLIIQSEGKEEERWR